VTSAPYDDYGIPHVDMVLRPNSGHSGTAEGRVRNP